MWKKIFSCILRYDPRTVSICFGSTLWAITLIVASFEGYFWTVFLIPVLVATTPLILIGFLVSILTLCEKFRLLKKEDELAYQAQVIIDSYSLDKMKSEVIEIPKNASKASKKMESFYLTQVNNQTVLEHN